MYCNPRMSRSMPGNRRKAEDVVLRVLGIRNAERQRSAVSARALPWADCNQPHVSEVGKGQNLAHRKERMQKGRKVYRGESNITKTASLVWFLLCLWEESATQRVVESMWEISPEQRGGTQAEQQLTCFFNWHGPKLPLPVSWSEHSWPGQPSQTDMAKSKGSGDVPRVAPCREFPQKRLWKTAI